MKTFIASLSIIMAVLIFVIWNAATVTGKINALLEIIENLPADAEAFDAEADAISDEIERLRALWDEAMPFLTLTVGYDNLNRADESFIALYVSYGNRNGDDFTVARMHFCDGLHRLRTLEGFHPDGIF